MNHKEKFSRIATRISSAFRSAFSDSKPAYKIRGDVFVRLQDVRTGTVEHREMRNLIVRDASILVARLVKDNSEPTKGAYVLAIGTGDVGWNPLSPPAATSIQRALYSELTRKTFADTQYIDSLGAPTATPTNVVDFTTIFTESEAVGPLVEMGLLGGNISTNLAVKNPVSPPNGTYDASVDLTTKETLLNYLTFAVINKPATSTMELTWRLTF